MKNLDFDSLLPASDKSWCDTFAYWLLVLYQPDNTYARVSEEACTAMSYQYDVEDQAQGVEHLASTPELIPSVFKPIAPVTFALRWSPFPTAIKVLGEPLHLDSNDSGGTIATFVPKINFVLNGQTPDERHFDFLLGHASRLAVEANAIILLVGAPGWSYDLDYDSEDASQEWIDHQPRLQKFMRDFGFVYTHHKPIEG